MQTKVLYDNGMHGVEVGVGEGGQLCGVYRGWESVGVWA